MVATLRIRFSMLPAVIGFCVGIVLDAYTFYSNYSHTHRASSSDFLFLVLCPPSFAALALDDAGVVGGLLGWLLISLANAVLYTGIWVLLKWLFVPAENRLRED